MSKKMRRIKAFRAFFKRNKNIRETNFADNSLIDISFQSVNFPSRSVWITDCGNLFFIDLEDTNDKMLFDNTVFSFACFKEKIGCEIILAWSNGVSIDEMLCHISYWQKGSALHRVFRPE